MKSYSAASNRNDLFVVDVLEGKRNGYFVEAGALDGMNGSNTLLLEEDYGWTGLCVEADPQLFEECRRKRRCTSENVCLYNTAGKVEFMGGAQGWGGVLQHLDPNKSEHWRLGQPIIVRAVSLGELLERHMAPAVIDYLSLDTEGSEYMILKDFPFDRFRFQVISIEGSSCNQLLANNGYRRVNNPFNKAAPWEQYFLFGELPLRTRLKNLIRTPRKA